MDPDLALALELADAADELTMDRFRTHDLVVEEKPDLTPVTEADRDAEQMLRERLLQARAGDGIVGEEYGETGGGPRRWILDPVDGTKSYARGVPIWATLIALEVDGSMRVGVASAPALGRRWWAARGEGAFANGEPIRVSGVGALEDALLCYTSGPAFDQYGLGDQFRSLAARCWAARGFADFWGHVLVAEGSADVAVEPVMNLWDNAPLQVIVEEAGGRFTDLDGVARSDGGNALSTNGRLHDQALAALRRSS
ncbi:MAG TPA: histidinol-phosphatase [Acidimicrobiia bacterium]